MLVTKLDERFAATQGETTNYGRFPLSIWLAIAFVSFAGGCALLPPLSALYKLWTGDALRSIGALLFLSGIVLTLRAWKQEGWPLHGTMWGLLPIVGGVVLGSLYGRFTLTGQLGSRLHLFLNPPGLSIFLYGSGVILLFAGPAVWRKALFPLVLFLFSNPFPGGLSTLLDVPLQHISANTARAFATFIHFAPSNTQLRLMFSPDFGMFIAPGCDGIRGAITLGYLALITGYLKRFRPLRWALTVIGAVLLGYLFNLLRLCVLVLYYRAVIGHHWWQTVGAQADYVIGSCLFFVATILFVWVLRSQSPTDSSSEDIPAQPQTYTPQIKTQVLYRLAAFSALLLVTFTIDGAVLLSHPATVQASSPRQFPARIGDYQLERTWKEEIGGHTVSDNAMYLSPRTHKEVRLGIWVAPVRHNAHDSRITRGQEPLQRAIRSLPTAHQTVEFDAAYYEDGISDTLLGALDCTPSKCRQYSSQNRVELFFYMPSLHTLLNKQVDRQVPMLVSVEAPQNGDITTQRRNLDHTFEDFVQQTDFLSLSREFQ